MQLVSKIMKKFKGGEDLESKTLRAAFWSLVGSGGNGIIRFISNLILTRILFPEAFGLMATAMLFMTLVQVLSDTGVKIALIQHPEGASTAFINTSFLITIIRNGLLFLLVIAGIDPISNYYGQPDLQPLLWVMSATFLLEGLINPALPILIKSLRIEKQVSYNIGSQLAGFIFTLILAIALRSAQALAWGYLITSLFRVIGSYLILPYRPQLIWDRYAGRELLNFGKFILLNTMITWAALNLDRFVIGKTLGMEQLGLYNIALFLGVFLTDVMVQVFAQSYFPAVSSISQDREKVTNIYRRTMQVITSLAIPATLLLSAFSNDIISLLYDPRYQVAGLALFWISLRSAVQIIVNVQGGTLLALGRPKLVTISNAIGLLILLLSLPSLSSEFGLMGAGIAILVSSIATGLIQVSLFRSRLDFKISILLQPWVRLALNTGVIIGTHRLLDLLIPTHIGGNALLLILTSIVSLALVYLQIRRNLDQIMGSILKEQGA